MASSALLGFATSCRTLRTGAALCKASLFTYLNASSSVRAPRPNTYVTRPDWDVPAAAAFPNTASPFQSTHELMSLRRKLRPDLLRNERLWRALSDLCLRNNTKYPWDVSDYRVYLQCCVGRLTASEIVEVLEAIDRDGHLVDSRMYGLATRAMIPRILKLVNVAGKRNPNLLLEGLRDIAAQERTGTTSTVPNPAECTPRVFMRPAVSPMLPPMKREIRANARRRDFAAVNAIYESSRSASGAPNMAVAVEVLHAHSTFGDPTHAEQVHAEACASIKDTESTAGIDGAMIRCHVRHGKLADARILYRRSREQGDTLECAAYCALLRSFIHHGSAQEFNETLADMRVREVRINERTYACIIKGLFEFASVEEARSVYEEALDVCNEPEVDIDTAFLTGLIRSGDNMEESTTLLLNLLARADTKEQRQRVDPVLLVLAMQNTVRQWRLDQAAEIARWCLTHRTHLDAIVLVKMIHVFCLVGDLDRALRLLRGMRAAPGSRVHPKHLQAARSTLRNLDASKLPTHQAGMTDPLQTAYACVVQALCKRNLTVEAERLLSEASEQAGSTGPTYTIIQPLLQLYAKLRDRRKYIHLMETMLRVHDRPPDAKILSDLYQVYFSVYHSIRDAPRKQRLRPLTHLLADLQRMFSMEQSLVATTYDAAIDSHLQHGEWGYVEQIFVEMQESGVDVAPQTLLALVKAYREKGEVDKADALEMELEGRDGSTKLTESKATTADEAARSDLQLPGKDALAVSEYRAALELRNRMAQSQV
ncbi:hypothetical protein HKX48_003811 [Thoreauomyces humboldtii]|nr:hypothetical protein HKX48_003811 [Thoreauomyces humboldtii]